MLLSGALCYAFRVSIDPENLDRNPRRFHFAEPEYTSQKPGEIGVSVILCYQFTEVTFDLGNGSLDVSNLGMPQ